MQGAIQVLCFFFTVYALLTWGCPKSEVAQNRSFEDVNETKHSTTLP